MRIHSNYLLLFALPFFALSAQAMDFSRQFIHAAAIGKIAMVAELVEQAKTEEARTALINGQDSQGMTPLMWAIFKGHNNIVKALLKYGADVNVNDRFGATALILTTVPTYSDLAVIKSLIEHGAHIDAQNNNGSTALIFATKINKTDIVEELLKHEAHVNIQDKCGWTALMHAILNRNKDIVELLLNHNAQVNITNNVGQTALDIARSTENQAIIKILAAKSS